MAFPASPAVEEGPQSALDGLDLLEPHLSGLESLDQRRRQPWERLAETLQPRDLGHGALAPGKHGGREKSAEDGKWEKALHLVEILGA